MPTHWLNLNLAWRRIRLERLNRLTTLGKPGRQWRWTDSMTPPLLLIDARGREWEFKLSAGAWIRPRPVPKKNQPKNSR